jgi:ATP-dependent RNA helicase RhlE
MKFSELNIINPLLKALDKVSFDTPTEVQEKVIPLALEWNDILATAQTWSGKTLAFCLPTLQKFCLDNIKREEAWEKPKRLIKSLIIAPTRELCVQIWETFAPYCINTNLKHTVIFGWVNDFHQKKAIEKWVDIVIATPWRLEDLISQWVIKLSYVEVLVLDEADRMLDLWFLSDVKKIIKRVWKARQTMLFSATMPSEVRKLASEIMNNPKEISVHKVNAPTKNITQQVFYVKNSFKRHVLQYLVKKKEFDSIIVFVRTWEDTVFVNEYVKSVWVKSENIFKWKSQNARQKALKALKSWEIKVLVATDIASRWLDISDLSCVINYNIPNVREDYVHRIWRTARAWKKGIAISICNETDKENLVKIEKLIWYKIDENTNIDYQNEVIPESKILGYTDFKENYSWDTRKKPARKTTKKSVFKHSYDKIDTKKTKVETKQKKEKRENFTIENNYKKFKSNKSTKSNKSAKPNKWKR